MTVTNTSSIPVGRFFLAMHSPSFAIDRATVSDPSDPTASLVPQLGDQGVATELFWGEGSHNGESIQVTFTVPFTEDFSRVSLSTSLGTVPVTPITSVPIQLWNSAGVIRTVPILLAGPAEQVATIRLDSTYIPVDEDRPDPDPEPDRATRALQAAEALLDPSLSADDVAIYLDEPEAVRGLREILTRITQEGSIITRATGVTFDSNGDAVVALVASANDPVFGPVEFPGSIRLRDNGDVFTASTESVCASAGAIGPVCAGTPLRPVDDLCAAVNTNPFIDLDCDPIDPTREERAREAANALLDPALSADDVAVYLEDPETVRELREIFVRVLRENSFGIQVAFIRFTPAGDAQVALTVFAGAFILDGSILLSDNGTAFVASTESVCNTANTLGPLCVNSVPIEDLCETVNENPFVTVSCEPETGDVGLVASRG